MDSCVSATVGHGCLLSAERSIPLSFYFFSQGSSSCYIATVAPLFAIFWISLLLGGLYPDSASHKMRGRPVRLLCALDPALSAHLGT